MKRVVAVGVIALSIGLTLGVTHADTWCVAAGATVEGQDVSTTPVATAYAEARDDFPEPIKGTSPMPCENDDGVRGIPIPVPVDWDG